MMHVKYKESHLLWRTDLDCPYNLREVKWCCKTCTFMDNSSYSQY